MNSPNETAADTTAAEDVQDMLEITKDLRIALEEWSRDLIVGASPNATKEINAALGNADSTREQLEAVIARCKGYAGRKKGGQG